jgi:hypothetical protein
MGGDVRGDRNREVWCALAESIRREDPGHLMTYHPFGRTQSSRWFHSEPWLSFNMFQSGHRRYDQRPEDESPLDWRGEDNWRYVLEDHAREPAKPTIDGEPSYEDIPQGLHDPSQPRWTDDDCRRYAYWSVFAGSFGHTFGNNAVMQMHKPGSGQGSYSVRCYWHEAIHHPGAGQMTHLRDLMATIAYTERSYAPHLIDGDPGEGYDRLIATAGRDFALVYTHTGRPLRLALGSLQARRLSASWFRPKDGSAVSAGSVPNRGVRTFEPPPAAGPDRDRVLVLRRADP